MLLNFARATRAAASSFVLSPVPAAQDDREDQILSPASFFGSVSWLDTKQGQTPKVEGQTPKVDGFSTNWLSDASVPEESLDSARSNVSSNWLRARGGAHDAQE